MIEASWTGGLLDRLRGYHGWRVREGRFRERLFLFPESLLESCPRKLRDEGAHGAFDALVRHHEVGCAPLHDWWLERSGDATEKLFVLDCRSGPWDIPWEFLLGSTSIAANRRSLTLVRTLGRGTSHDPIIQREKLRLMLVQGADGAARGAPLDLQGEERVLREAWKQLEGSVRDTVQEPITVPARREELMNVLQREKPHVLWYSGHGRSRPRIGLEFQGANGAGEWVDAREFARLLSRSGHVPRYAVFLACETGRGDVEHEGTGRLPRLYQELHRVGVAAVLAMQANVRDGSRHCPGRRADQAARVGVDPRKGRLPRPGEAAGTRDAPVGTVPSPGLGEPGRLERRPVGRASHLVVPAGGPRPVPACWPGPPPGAGGLRPSAARRCGRADPGRGGSGHALAGAPTDLDRRLAA